MQLESWSITVGDSDYPLRLADHARSAEWPTLFGIGHRENLQQKSLGLICSVKCPGAVVIKTYDAIRELRDAGIVVAGGFHSPMERECLDFLLRGEQPVIICPARNSTAMRLPSVWRTGLESGRVVVVSCFDRDVRRPTGASANLRNEFVAALSAAVLIPHATPGGKADAIANQVLQDRRPLFTFADGENRQLLANGAALYDIDQMKLATGRRG